MNQVNPNQQIHSKTVRAQIVHWFLVFFGYRGIPKLARPTFRNEFFGQLCSNIGGGLLVVQLLQLIYLDIFKVSSDYAPFIATISMIGMAAGSFIGKHLSTRPKIPYIVGARLGVAALLIIASMLPISSTGAFCLTLLLVVGFILQSLVINVQSRIWQSNYPPAVRGKIVGKLMVFKIIFLGLASQFASQILTINPNSMHIVLAGAGVCFLLSAKFYSRIRIRRERSAIAHNKTHKVGFLSQFSILKHDKYFAKYMLLQMLSGMCVMSLQGVLIPVFKARFESSIALAALITILNRSIFQVIFSPIAGNIFDRIGTMRFRSINTSLWASSIAIVGIGFWQYSLALVIVGYSVMGIAQATGGVVWNIGHTRFAPRGKGQIYMGVHQSLTGARGLVMPLLGYYIFQSVAGLGLMLTAAVVQFGVSAAFFFSKEPTLADHDD